MSATLIASVQQQETDESELRNSLSGRLLAKVYASANCKQRWRIARPLMNAILRIEGPMYSATARRLLDKFHGLKVGAYSYGPFFSPGAFPPGVTIGRYVSVAYSVQVYNANHPIDWLSTHPFFYDPRSGIVDRDLSVKKELVIGDDCWLGAGAIIAPGCQRIGIGAVIGSGAVVTKDVPDFAIVGGVPARVLRYRFSPDTQQRILDSRWWMSTIDQIKECVPSMTQAVGSLSHHPLLGTMSRS